MDQYDPSALPDYLQVYYKRLFPYGPYFRWLNYGGVPKSYFQKREFSFTLAEDVYVRYQSFMDQQEMEKEIQKKCPHKIDIGAVFSHRPREHKTAKATFTAVEKELVFDIDMTDYDDVRKCCSGADICEKCWTLMKIAIKIMDRALREDFGWQHLLWVYSGRRGVHCWVCDASARKLSQAARSAVAEYLTLVKGGDQQKRKVILAGADVHPSVQAALEVVTAYFEPYCLKQQDILATDEDLDKFLSLVPDKPLADMLRKDLTHRELTSSKLRWAQFKKRLEKELGGDKRWELRKSSRVEKEVMLTYCYPRLDVNVSKGVNHLLKSPFCVHPKTGRICVPIDPENVDDFDPFTVPRISDVLEELNKWEKDNSATSGEPGKLKDYKKTSLRAGVELLENFVAALEADNPARIQQSDQKMEF